MRERFGSKASGWLGRACRVLGVAFACALACGGGCGGGGDDGGGGGSGGVGPDGIPVDLGCVERGLPCLGCPVGEFCWKHPAPYGGNLRTIAADGDTNVWAAGDDETLLHWDGVGWRTWRLPEGQSANRVSVVPGATWVASTGGVYRYDGERWGKIELPDELGATPSAIAGLSFDQVWVAAGRRAALLSGGSWAVGQTGISNVSAIWAASADEAFAIGSGLDVAHFVGGAWTQTKLEGTAPLSVLGGSSPTNVWVADSDSASGVHSSRTLYRWDGATWTPQQGVTSNTPAALAVSAEGSLWIAHGDSSIYHGAGAQFATTPPLGRPYTPYGFGDEITAITTAGPTGAWAVGLGGHILRFDPATGWSTQNAPPDEALGRPVAIGPGDVWVPGIRFLHHYGNGAWTQAEPYEGALFARRIFVESPTSLWSAFSNRGIWHYDGAAWTLFNGDDAIDDATEVWAKGSDVWAVLESDTIVRLAGGAWAPIDPGIRPVNLWGTGAGPYVVGVDGEGKAAVRLYDGAAFQPVDFGGGEIRASFGHADGSVWLLVERGQDSVLVRLSAEPRVEQSGPPKFAGATGLWVGSGSDIWLAGIEDGKTRAFHWDGQAWTSHATPRSGTIASDGTDVFMGAGAGVLRLNRGG
jgi:hypothetical protein